jgi:hypothetical protein
MYEVMIEANHVYLGNVSRKDIMKQVTESVSRNTSGQKDTLQGYCYTKKEGNGYLIRVTNVDKESLLYLENFISDIARTMFNKVDLLIDKMFIFDGKEGYYCDNFIISVDRKGVVYNLK